MALDDPKGLEAKLAIWFNALPDGGMGKEHFDALLAIVRQHAGEGEAEPVGKEAILTPSAHGVTLERCPTGLFHSSTGALCLKTEYGNNEGRIDAYIVDSGEFFWGHSNPQSIASQRAEVVYPVLVSAAPHPHQVPEGMVLVPREPTEAMCAADAGTATTDRLAWNRALYRAMIAAPPSKQASASADQGGE